jgi:hypothetical protein
MILISRTGIGLYCDQARELMYWVFDENNRIKRYKLIKIAEKTERLYRKSHRWDLDNKQWFEDLPKQIDYSNI